MPRTKKPEPAAIAELPDAPTDFAVFRTRSATYGFCPQDLVIETDAVVVTDLTAAQAEQITAILNEVRSDALNAAWRTVDALGGTYSAEEREERWADGYEAALTDACEALSKLGGKDPDPDVGQLRTRIRRLQAENAMLRGASRGRGNIDAARDLPILGAIQ